MNQVKGGWHLLHTPSPHYKLGCTDFNISFKTSTKAFLESLSEFAWEHALDYEVLVTPFAYS